MPTYFRFDLQMEAEFADGQEPADKRAAVAVAMNRFANFYKTANASTPGIEPHSSAKKGRVIRENDTGGFSFKWRGGEIPGGPKMP